MRETRSIPRLSRRNYRRSTTACIFASTTRRIRAGFGRESADTHKFSSNATRSRFAVCMCVRARALVYINTCVYTRSLSRSSPVHVADCPSSDLISSLRKSASLSRLRRYATSLRSIGLKNVGEISISTRVPRRSSYCRGHRRRDT